MTLATFKVISRGFTCLNLCPKHKLLVDPKQTVLKELKKKRVMRKRMGLIGAQCNNQMELGRGSRKDGGDTKMSNNLSILFARVPSLYSRYTSFLCLSSNSPYGQGIVAAAYKYSAGKTKQK